MGGERVAQLQQDVHAGAVLLGPRQRRVAVLLGPAVGVGHVVGGDHRDHGAVGAAQHHPRREAIPGDRPSVVEGLVVVDELDAAAVDLRPGRALPEHDVAHGLLGAGAGSGRGRHSEGGVAGGGVFDLRQAPPAGLVEGDELGVLGQDLGHGCPEPVEAGAARDVGLRHGDLALDRASHRAVDGSEVTELGGPGALAALSAALGGRGGGHHHHQADEEREPHEDDQDGQSGEQQLLHDRSVRRSRALRRQSLGTQVRSDVHALRPASVQVALAELPDGLELSNRRPG